MMSMRGGVFRYKTKRGELWGFKICVNYKQIKRMGYPTKDRALSALINLRGQKGVDVRKYTFKMAQGAFMDQQSTLVKKTTLTHYKHMLSKHFADFPEKPIDDITFGDLYAWFYAQKVSIDMKERLLLLLKKIFEHAEVYFGVRNIEYKKLVIPKDYTIKKAKEKFVLTKEEFVRFYKKLNGNYWQCLFLTAFICGLRVGELRGLQIKCLSLDKGLLQIIQEANSQVGEGKTVLLPPKSSSSNRDYYLPDFFVSKLKNFIADSGLKDEDFLFFGHTKDKPVGKPNLANPIGTMTIYRVMDEAQKAAGIKHFNFHYFRHSEASFLNEKGISQEWISDYLGHDSVDVTRKYYIHDSSEKKKEIRDLLENKFKGDFEDDSEDKKEDK